MMLMRDMAHPFDYRQLQQHPELRARVEHWGGYERIRRKLFEQLASAGFDRHEHSILLEYVGAGFGYYGYVAVIGGDVFDFGETGESKLPNKRIPVVERLVASLTDDRIVRMRGSRSRNARRNTTTRSS